MKGARTTMDLGYFRYPFNGLHCLRRRTAWRTSGTAVAAAILSQIADQAIHHREVRRIKELTTFAPLRDQSGSLKIL
jgi:hypothetical protein